MGFTIEDTNHITGPGSTLDYSYATYAVPNYGYKGHALNAMGYVGAASGHEDKYTYDKTITPFGAKDTKTWNFYLSNNDENRDIIYCNTDMSYEDASGTYCLIKWDKENKRLSMITELRSAPEEYDLTLRNCYLYQKTPVSTLNSIDANVEGNFINFYNLHRMMPGSATDYYKIGDYYFGMGTEEQSAADFYSTGNNIVYLDITKIKNIEIANYQNTSFTSRLFNKDSESFDYTPINDVYTNYCTYTWDDNLLNNTITHNYTMEIEGQSYYTAFLRGNGSAGNPYKVLGVASDASISIGSFLYMGDKSKRPKINFNYARTTNEVKGGNALGQAIGHDVSGNIKVHPEDTKFILHYACDYAEFVPSMQDYRFGDTFETIRRPAVISPQILFEIQSPPGIIDYTNIFNKIDSSITKTHTINQISVERDRNNSDRIVNNINSTEKSGSKDVFAGIANIYTVDYPIIFFDTFASKLDAFAVWYKSEGEGSFNKDAGPKEFKIKPISYFYEYVWDVHTVYTDNNQTSLAFVNAFINPIVSFVPSRVSEATSG